MKHETPRAAPTFFWQGLFVLLPVFVLAGLGLYSLRQDRLLAAQEARQRAAQTVRQISAALGEAGTELACYNWLCIREDQLWFGSRAASEFPEALRSGIRNDTQERESMELDWKEHNRTDRAPPPQPNLCVFDASGHLEYPRDSPTVPEPPVWLSKLSAPQRAAWTRARVEEASGLNPAPARAGYAKFLALQPGPSAMANARFALLLLDFKTNPPDAAIARLLEFARWDAFLSTKRGQSPQMNADGERRDAFLSGKVGQTILSASNPGSEDSSEPVATESGLPLSALALARALELAKPTGLTQPFLEAFRLQLRDAPSILLPRLLDQAGALAQSAPNLRGAPLLQPSAFSLQPLPSQSAPNLRDALLQLRQFRDALLQLRQFRDALLQLRQSMDSAEQLRALAREVSSHRPLSGSGASFWVGPAGREWLAMLAPPRGGQWSATNQAGSARFFPKALVEHALRRALAKSNVEIPPYLSLEVLLEGRRIDLTNPPSGGGTPPDQSPLLAEEETRLPVPSAQPDNTPPAANPINSRPSAVRERYVASSRYGGLIVDFSSPTHPGVGVGHVSHINDAHVDPYSLPLSSNNPVSSASTADSVASSSLSPHPSDGNLRSSASSADLAVVLRLYLTHPALLYAAQRQRTLWFVCLITAAAAAVVAGFLASRRAFLRQRQLNEMKSNFVSSVSHELRAPIASVRLMAESLERGRIAEPQKQLEYFHFIVQECRRLTSLVENLLDFSRIEQGRKEYEFESTDLSALVIETVKLMEPAAAERQIRLETLLPPEPLAAAADGNALQQALVNLLDNAIKHSPPNSVVTVGLEQSAATPGKPCLPIGERGQNLCSSVSSVVNSAKACLWVEDRGPGIPSSEHTRIFERFYRRGSELRRETRGVGIGLSIVQHIVEAHRGQILVRSAEGRGSRFTIELPLDPTSPAIPRLP
jgi:signal transduction histidine kinase